MGAVADGALNEGGKVIEFHQILQSKEIAHLQLTELISG
jgi:predicted Rossmann-fold nucleotide-binding protein